MPPSSTLEGLLEKATEKLKTVENVLLHCQQEQYELDKNLTKTHADIQSSLKHHIETLNCRANWLEQHAANIHSLKKKAISQKTEEMTILKEKLMEYLTNGHPVEESDIESGMIADILKSTVSTDMLENSAMGFLENESLEEALVKFGEINVAETSLLCDAMREEDVTQQQQHGFDMCSDANDEEEDGSSILVIDNKRKASIELEVKSIEMRHLTSESANQESERNKLANPMLFRGSSEENEDFQRWLLDGKSVDEKEKESSDKMTKSMEDLSKWLLNAIMHSQSSPEDNEIESVNEDKIWLSRSISSTNDEKASISPSLFEFNTDQCSVLENFNRIRSTDYKEYLVKKSTDEIAPLRIPAPLTPLADAGEDSGKDNNAESHVLENCSQILGANMQGYLIKKTPTGTTASQIWKIATPADFFKDQFLHNPTNNATNSTNSANNSTTYSATAKPLFVTHMQSIATLPYEQFLHRNQPNRPRIDPSLCKWLKGDIGDPCSSCKTECAFNDSDKNWLATATDW